ncbi:hypothetical protein HK102_003167 [Quaeritorhiza haematococci]|nr:hypothetical protein HK102_003167 [Quaeritorhiza haematococci]
MLSPVLQPMISGAEDVAHDFVAFLTIFLFALFSYRPSLYEKISTWDGVGPGMETGSSGSLEELGKSGIMKSGGETAAAVNGVANGTPPNANVSSSDTPTTSISQPTNPQPSTGRSTTVPTHLNISSTSASTKRNSKVAQQIKNILDVVHDPGNPAFELIRSEVGFLKEQIAALTAAWRDGD